MLQAIIIAGLTLALRCAFVDAAVSIVSTDIPFPMSLGTQLPRFSRGTPTASADIGAYKLSDCADNTSLCTISSDFMDTLVSGSPGTFVDYLDGIVIYGLIHIAAALLFPCCITIIIFQRCVWRCCCKPASCSCLRCGLPYPTIKRSWYGCGARVLPSGEVGYKRSEKHCVRILMTLSIVISCGMIAMSQLLGVQNISTSFKTAAVGVMQPFMDISVSLPPPTIALISGMASDVILPTTVAFRALSLETIDFEADLECLRVLNDSSPLLEAVLDLQAAKHHAFSASEQMRMLHMTLADELQSYLVIAGNCSLVYDTHAEEQVALVDAIAEWSTSKLALVGNNTDVALAQAEVLDAQHGFAWTIREAASAGRRSGGLPPVSVTTAAAAYLQKLIDGMLAGDTYNTSLLVSSLQLVQNYTKLMPNYTQAAVAYGQLSTHVADLQLWEPLLEVNRTMQWMADATDAIMSAAESQMDIAQRVYPAVSARQSLVPILSTLNAIAAAFSSVPTTQSVIDIAERIRTIADNISCATGLVSDLTGVHNDIFALPGDIGTSLSGWNSSAQFSVTIPGYVDGWTGNMTTLNLDAPALIFGTASSNWTAFDNALNSHIVQSGMYNSYRIVRDVAHTAHLLLENATLQLDRLYHVLQGFESDAVSLAQLIQLAADAASATVQVNSAVGVNGQLGYLQMYSVGVCTIDSSQCWKDSDCIGVGTCSNRAAGKCAADLSIACTNDAQCATGAADYCVADAARLLALKTLLGSLSDPAVDAALNNIAASMSTLVDISSNRTAAHTALTQSGLEAAVAVTSIIVSLDPLPSYFSFAAVNATLDIIPAVINQTFTAIRQQDVDSVHETLNSMQPSTIELAIDVFTAWQFVAVDCTGVVENRFRTDYLSTLTSTRLLKTIFVSLDASIRGLQNRQSYISLPAIPLNETKDLLVEWSEKLTGTGQYASLPLYGAMNFIFQLITPSSLVTNDKTQVMYMTTTQHGERYLEDRYCLQDDCMTASIKNLLGDQTDSWKDVPPVSGIGASIETILLLLWLPVVLAGCLGVVAMAAPRCARLQSLQLLASYLNICTLACQIPCILLIVGMCMIPMLFLADFCTYGFGLFANMVIANEAYLCDAAGGLLESDICKIDYMGMTVDIPIKDAVSDMLGGCTSGAYDHTLVSVNHQLIHFINDTLVNNAVSKMTGFGLPIKQSMATIIDHSTASFVHELAADMPAIAMTIRCSKIHAAVDSFRHAICAEGLGPVYWYFAGWCIAGWVLLCIGFPAAMCGLKRFPTEPWGPVVQALDDVAVDPPAAAPSPKKYEVPIVDKGVFGTPERSKTPERTRSPQRSRSPQRNTQIRTPSGGKGGSKIAPAPDDDPTPVVGRNPRTPVEASAPRSSNEDGAASAERRQRQDLTRVPMNRNSRRVAPVSPQKKPKAVAL